MSAVSVNDGDGVCLIKPAKLYMCTHNATHTELMCLIWHRTLGLWPRETGTTGKGAGVGVRGKGASLFAVFMILLPTKCYKNAYYDVELEQ